MVAAKPANVVALRRQSSSVGGPAGFDRYAVLRLPKPQGAAAVVRISTTIEAAGGIIGVISTPARPGSIRKEHCSSTLVPEFREPKSGKQIRQRIARQADRKRRHRSQPWPRQQLAHTLGATRLRG